MTEGTGAAVAGATAGAHNATVSIAELEDALKAARQRELEMEPDRLVAAAEAALAKAKQHVEYATDALRQAKHDADAMRKERAAAAEKENG